MQQHKNRTVVLTSESTQFHFPLFTFHFSLLPMPPTYLCQRCTACCRWPGFVRVTEEEVRAIASHVDMEEEAFIQEYTRLRPNRGGLALIDREDGACFFLQGDECSIQSVKPQQCKDFPNSWNFPGWREVCEAIEVPARDKA